MQAKTLPKKHEKKSELIVSVLHSPVITEKAALLAESNQYVFQVMPSTNKIMIKEAIEGLYNVSVLRVNITTLPGKTRRRGNTTGHTSGIKKAIVKLKEGDKIEIGAN
ncbi:MAG: 50S ribosomal protein L23 [Candidatus Portnoybacteria bacterium CG10_big_fil_rev_8_21_14_0_10_36_7]|uniref:Large ribosomal subunit protein uL23 n=1 Tax=Candidatus Portnoybacteria bacterium CG10_big_fil_rev_8_21_14_0_10_36_7 TaxID=1974812 RepID=A0A2M8KDH0_9BACT|nr:MAG: 50S ribosomal protein L23 [Candidatus Portnoybacteria bacterium CG10_big_fil_rev_8_21_14_0_10_36_7]